MPPGYFFLTFHIKKMVVNNKLEYILSGAKVFVGYLFIFTGAIIAFLGQIMFGLSVSTLALFFITTFSGVEIDTTNKKIKQYNKLFGIIKTGRWQSLDFFIGLTLIPVRKINTIASRANITNSVVQKDYRIYLVNKNCKPAFPIKICKNMEQAQNSIDELSIWMKLPVYSRK